MTIENGNKQRNKRRSTFIGLLVTADAIVLAGLLMWSQHWLSLYQIHEEQGDAVWQISLALAGIYSAALSCLLSALIGLYAYVKDDAQRALRGAVALGGFAGTVAISIVVLSMSTSLWNAASEERLMRPLPSVSWWNPEYWTVVAELACVATLFAWWRVSRGFVDTLVEGEAALHTEGSDEEEWVSSLTDSQEEDEESQVDTEEASDADSDLMQGAGQEFLKGSNAVPNFRYDDR